MREKFPLDDVIMCCKKRDAWLADFARCFNVIEYFKNKLYNILDINKHNHIYASNDNSADNSKSIAIYKKYFHFEL